MMIAVVVLLVLVVLWRLRRRAKRAMVAGLDKPAIWREPAPGRVGNRLKDGLL